ncbi:MAG: malto-oligosyltrehalose trehalohydrolase [Candidatus Caenarcaniphilales bacterium]|nr:malto-oligosyltrehalose trehalohydrolase [Candidatus Caenarcaniphilales bacterium]
MKFKLISEENFLNNHPLELLFWSDTAKTVDLIIEKDDLKLPMLKSENNFFALSSNKIKEDEPYYFLIDNNLKVPDPLSREQSKDIHNASVLTNPAKYQWKTKDWKGLDWDETIIYELHLGTFSSEGTFDGARQKLDYLKELGITAIELMPISDFPGQRNWGYDGVLHYAPDKSYGTPDDLKKLIDEAHQNGIMVFLDVVYNHFGPEGNYLWCYAKSFFNDKYHTPWGSAINFDDKNSEVVREFFIQNTIYWLKEFRFDGLRYDAVHAIFDNSPKHILHEIKERALQELPSDQKVHFILENDNNDSELLQSPNKTEEENKKLYTAQWNDDFHHCLHVLTTKEEQGYYEDYTENTFDMLGKSLSQGFVYQGEISKHREGKNRGKSTSELSPLNFVNFIQNHDQIGNRAFGERLHQLISKEQYRMAAAIYLLCPSVPMLFMGEEWLSDNPFLYFCDFEPDLSAKVREGRAKEFANFPGFNDTEKLKQIPDPTDIKTFETSRLNWGSLKEKDKMENFEFYKQLIHSRKIKINPLLKGKFIESGYKVINDKILSVYWSFQANNQLREQTTNLNILMNFSEQATDLKKLIADFALQDKQKNPEIDFVFHLKSSNKSTSEQSKPEENLQSGEVICFTSEAK